MFPLQALTSPSRGRVPSPSSYLALHGKSPPLAPTSPKQGPYLASPGYVPSPSPYLALTRLSPFPQPLPRPHTAKSLPPASTSPSHG
ncbi:hypothetical protein RRG08_020801 [Elysia crispata]|uniref:Uncharacterized protein n=1 Tax=Elysia crispata TaxID=231223 RepID=A0AAE0YLN9_9GAST|nr:hypothetical protein RRG08_020801 [Elysia crispata]